MPYVKVALDVPLPTLFDYSFDAETENARDLAGRRVVVPFGRRDLVGLVLATTDSTGVDPARVKPLRSVKAPLAVSRNTCVAPAASSAATCASRVWASVLTRAYPMIVMVLH